MGLFTKTSKLSLHSIYSNIKHAIKKGKFKHALSDHLNNNTTAKLHIGCGGSIMEGWLNIDFEHIEKGAFFMDASLPFPIPNNTFDYIYSEHLFEHLNLDGQLNMLNESYRILKKNGVMRIATPNFDFIMSVHTDSSPFINEYINWSADNYFPNKVEILGKEIKNDTYLINNYFHNWGHQFIHSPKTLAHLLSHTGFKKFGQVKIYESEYTIFRNIETHGNVIPKAYNDVETMVFEAVK